MKSNGELYLVQDDNLYLDKNDKKILEALTDEERKEYEDLKKKYGMREKYIQ